ncbi:DUF1513 domain-containing protein [Roseovarius faecimaris]|uniref:DUF1513 domain-containing protein n=1 Tax=Roseovarius faecimaris TaxID=2494550 RepID=A0A6I6IRW4_9RHOB|nr:DUF1513 domain-containing protein [Roseovarius faecimaris]QGX99485.1 DUF1513 domain-containing protein [Roseovarius faecimaris]
MTRMKRREFVLAGGVSAVLAGCDAPRLGGADRLAFGATQQAAPPDLSGIDLYIPGYAPWLAKYQGVPVLEHPRMRRAIPKGYDQNITMLTRFGFDGSVRQALFPVRGHDIAISPDKRLGFFGSMERDTYVAFDPKTLDRIALGKPVRPYWIGGGHGAFLGNDLVAVTERAPKRPYSGKPQDHFGHVTLRDPRSLKIVGDFSTHGIAPHEIRILSDGSHAAIANYGSTVAPGETDYGLPRHIVEPSITVVEMESGKLVDKYLGNAREQLRHLCARDRETIFAIQAELIGEGEDRHFFKGQAAAHDADPTNSEGTSYAVAPTVRVNTASGRLVEVGTAAARTLMRHGLSIEFDEAHEEVIASYPATHTVMVFDAGSGALKHRTECQPIGLQYPCGIALLPGQEFYVVAGYMRNLYVFERGTHRLHRELCHYPLNFGHSHIVAA